MLRTEQLQQLAAWLAAAGIELLELRGPDGSLRLRRDGRWDETARDAAPASAGADAHASSAAALPGAASDVWVSAPGVGVFLQRHPMTQLALAPTGAQVAAGQPVGLLQIGALLLPVHAPRSGTVVAARVEHGTPVGYGTPLVQLQCE